MAQEQRAKTGLNAAEVRQIVGNIEDARVASIVALQPSQAELEAAVSWLDGGDEALREERPGLTGKVAAIYDLLEVDLEAEEDEP